MLPRLLRRLRAAIVRCPADCGAADPAPADPGRSFADGQVSPDQARIAAALPALLRPTSRVLHVGVGCSDLAVRFADRVARIDGVTVLADEQAVAEALGLPNYHVWTLNKHGAAFAARAAVAGPYDVVVDNNPGSFTCCVRHFRLTMDTYARGLAPGGRIVTDERGAGWRQRGGLALGWRRWAREGARVGLVAERLTPTVWALRREAGPHG